MRFDSVIYTEYHGMEKMKALPLTLPNIIFLSNEMSIHNKEIEKAAPPLLLTNIKKSIEIIERI